MNTETVSMSRRRLRLALTIGLLMATAAPASATDRCTYESVPAGERRLGEWIRADNWLHAGSRPSTLSAATIFMPATRMSVNTPRRQPPASPALDFERLPTTDPVDGSRRNLAFLLQSRLNADALIVLRNGQRIAEQYWNGTAPQAPRLLLSGTRPTLSLLGATAISQGKLAADKSAARPIAALAENVALRKLSMRRLLEGEAGYTWGATAIADWQRAGGWTSAAGEGVRAWLTRYDKWTALAPTRGLPPAEGRPEDELLAWAIADASGAAPARLFCEHIFSLVKPEDSALWLTDGKGHDLAAGLALSPRDHAKLGQLLLDARTNSKRSPLPNWLIEALAAPTGSLANPELAGLPAGSTLRYGFVRLGGKGSRIAQLGPYGTSLLVDFDRRLVVAIHASHPDADSALLRATLQETWRAIASALPPDRR